MAAAQLESDALLSAFMSSNNDVRRQAEATWEDMKQCVPDEVCVPIVPGTETGIGPLYRETS